MDFFKCIHCGNHLITSYVCVICGSDHTPNIGIDLARGESRTIICTFGKGDVITEDDLNNLLLYKLGFKR